MEPIVKVAKQLFLRQHRTILIVQIRSRFFVRAYKFPQAIVDLLPREFGRYDGKDARSCAIKASAANCAVLP